MSLAYFLAFACECVILNSSFILDVVRFKVCLFVYGHIVLHVSPVVGAIREHIVGGAICRSVNEFANEGSPAGVVHGAEPMGLLRLH